MDKKNDPPEMITIKNTFVSHKFGMLDFTLCRARHAQAPVSLKSENFKPGLMRTYSRKLNLDTLPKKIINVEIEPHFLFLCQVQRQKII